MAIDKLNFNGLGSASGSSNIKGALTNVGDRLMAYGANLSEQDLAKQKQQNIEDNQMIQNNKENMAIEKESANQKALLNYHNAATRASTIGTMSDEQNKALGAEFDSLVSKVGEEKAGQIISDKAAAFASADAAKLQSSPKLAYDRVSQLELPSGYNIDPLKLIAMKEQKLGSLQDKQNKLDDQAFKEKELKAQQDNADRSYKLQKQESDARIAERNDTNNAKKLEIQAMIPGSSIKDGVSYVKGQDGVYHAVSETSTGNKVLDYSKLNDEQKIEIEKLNTEFGSSFEDKLKKFEDNKSKIYTKEQLADEKFLYNEFHRLNPDAGNQSSVGRYFSKMSPGGESSDLMLEKRKIGIKLAELKGSPLQNIFRSEDTLKRNNEEIKKLEDQLKPINNAIESKNQNKNISFDDFKKQAELNSISAKKENDTISDEIAKSYNKLEKDMSSKYGLSEFKKDTKPATEDEVKSLVYKKTYNELKAKNPKANDIDIQYAAAKYANIEGDTQSKFINKKIEEGSEAKKDSLKESRKIQEKLIDNKMDEIKNTQNQIDKVNLLPDDKDVEFEGVSYKKSYYLKLLEDRKNEQITERDSLLGKTN